MNIEAKAKRFRELHLGGGIFVMANAWNAGSAILLQQAGFEALGTTSAGIAFSHGLPDYEAALSFETALEETRAIAAAVDVPLSMDAENGYGHTPEALFDTLRMIAETGVVGASIEDFTGNPSKPLYDIEMAAERIRAAKEAVADLGYPFTLTARAECYLTGHATPFEESLRRINRYREAGADCLYVPGLKDIESIAALVREAGAPVNVVMGLSGSAFSVGELRQAGVTRISIGGSLARATFGLVRRAAREMLEQGTFGYSDGQIPDDELCRLFSRRADG